MSVPGSQLVKFFLGAIYGFYTWLVFLALIVITIFIALLVPGLERRRRWVAAAAQASFHLVGTRPTVTGLDHIPPGHCIVVANHASYADGVILQAFLPPRFDYVIKGEMQKVPVVHFVLRRLGSRFVERFKASGSSRDARTLLKAAANGESLAFFPEGTFLKQPGLDRFRPGAFAAAINAGVPIVPVIISGSRRVMPSGAMLPRHGHLQIDILNPIDRSAPEYANSKDLANLARLRMLEVLDEPDLLSKTPGNL